MVGIVEKESNVMGKLNCDQEQKVLASFNDSMGSLNETVSFIFTEVAEDALSFEEALGYFKIAASLEYIDFLEKESPAELDRRLDDLKK